MFAPEDITPGETWACRYRTTRMLDANGKPVVNQKPGDTAAGPGEWESLGVILVRDRENRRLEIRDLHDSTTHIVDYGDAWDIDRAVLIDDSTGEEYTETK
jgi:predicted oxidoreductase